LAGRERIVDTDDRIALAGEHLAVVGDVVLVARNPATAMHPHDGGKRLVRDRRGIEYIEQSVRVGRVVALIELCRQRGRNVLLECLRRALGILVEGAADEQHGGPGTDLERNQRGQQQQRQDRENHDRNPQPFAAASLSRLSHGRTHWPPSRPSPTNPPDIGGSPPPLPRPPPPENTPPNKTPPHPPPRLSTPPPRPP